jgi:TolB-like protein
MSKKSSRRSVHFLIIFLLLTCSLPPSGSRCETAQGSSPASIAILPFATHAARDLSYLQDGIRAMLTSRLTADSKLTVIDPIQVDRAMTDLGMPAGRIEQNAALAQLAKQIHADYLLTGSLTALGEGMSLDAKIFSAASPEHPQTIYASAATENNLIAAVDQLAAAVTMKLSGSVPPAAAPAPAPTPAPVTAEEKHDTHPERPFRSAQRGGPALSTPSSGPTRLQDFTKSPNFNFRLQALDAGDLDGDGLDDLVLVGEDNVLHAYHQQENRFNEFGSVSLEYRYKIHAISLADLNENGRMEIYISAADEDEPYSFAAEWRDNEFIFLLQKEHWFIKAVNLPGQGMILAGQQHGLMSPMGPGVYQLHGKSEEGMSGPLQKGKRLPLPAGINVFAFVFADIDGDLQEEIVSIDQSDHLSVRRADGKLVWQSAARYGGTTRFVGRWPKVEDEFTDNALAPDKYKKIFIPCRLIAVDLNQDGLTDIVIDRNHLRWSPIFKNLKSYNSGQMLGLTWNGVNLTELWSSRQVDGYINGYQLLPVPASPGQALLYVGLNLLGPKESTVLLYTIDTGKAADQEKTED